MSVCCIVLNYFGAERTRACARALLGQPIETLYLVDNSAHAPQAEALRTLAAALAGAGAKFSVHVLCPAQNLGYAGGINAAVAADRAAGGHARYLLLNNDALLPPGAVATLVAHLCAEPSAALVAPRVRQGARSTCGLHYWPWLGHQTPWPAPFTLPFLTGACLLLDARAITRAGPFDADFFLYGEDVLLNTQIRRRGGVVRCVAGLEVEHAGSASAGHGSLFYEYHVARGHLLLARKLARSGLERRINLLGRGLYLPLRAMLRCARQRNLNPARALWRLLRGRAAPPPMASTAAHAGVGES